VALRQAGSGRQWEWLVCRHGQRDWKQGPTAREAIRRATLTAPRQQPGWLLDAAAQAVKELETSSL
jgi:hypothetical protein